MRSLFPAVGFCLAAVLGGCAPQHRVAVAPPPTSVIGDTTDLRRLLAQLDLTADEQRGVDSLSTELQALLENVKNDSTLTNLLSQHHAALDSLWQVLQQVQADTSLMSNLLHQNNATLDSLWNSLRCGVTPKATRPRQ